MLVTDPLCSFPTPSALILFLKIANLHLAVRKGEWQKKI